MPRRPKSKRADSHASLIRKKRLLGASAFFLALMVSISLFSHSAPDDTLILSGGVDARNVGEVSHSLDNRGGVIGAYSSMAAYFFIGYCALLIPLWLILGGARLLWRDYDWTGQAIRLCSYYTVAFFFLGVFLDNWLSFPDLPSTANRAAMDIILGYGGYLSLSLNAVFIKYLGGIGSFLTLLVVALSAITFALWRTPGMPGFSARVASSWGGAAGAQESLGRAWKRAFSRARQPVAIQEAGFLGGDEFTEKLREALAGPTPRVQEIGPDDNPDAQDDDDSPDEFSDNHGPQFAIPAEGAQRRRRSAKARQADLFAAPGQKSTVMGDYELPSLDFLASSPESGEQIDQKELTATAIDLRTALATFGVKIDGEIEMLPGPVITRFEFRPALGVKVNQIVNLSDDLALALRAKRIRIVAPIPGKAAVGIEVPIRKREMVFLKDIIGSQAFNTSDAALPIAFGKNIAGEPFVADLASMPHLLIAGATGAGKSVCINTIITSLLYRLSPAELRFVFIDPKMLELSVYAGIPHLERPVITDPKRAERALNDGVVEMEMRYKKLAGVGVRNIAEFNAKCATPQERLPYLVIIIDELADLMMSQSSAKSELMITRLAQMARAVGIHLILATQRPSVDVITGLIKANFPARVAFHVASKTDSRTILDANGAEKLLGKGDMLYLQSGQPEAVRLHGAYLSVEETSQIVEHVRAQKVEVPRIETIARDSANDSDPESSEKSVDPMYFEAVEIVVHHKQASVSLLQRRLGIGYQRAARLIDKMEAEGIVGPLDGARSREVLVDRGYLEVIRPTTQGEASRQVAQ